jgi:methionyl-tRNA formyltransferase
MVTCAYGQILSKEILDIAKYGVINIHASLLPKYRGSAPIQWSIINGDKQTGVTIMQTDVGVDTGDILKAVSLDIADTETAGELFERLSKLGAETIVSVLDDIENGNVKPIKQDEAQATHVGMLKKEDGKLDFTKSTFDIVNLIRGLNPWPIAFTYLKGKTLKVYSASQVAGSGKAGEVLFADVKNGLIVATGDGAIKINELQLEGSKKMTARDFLVGNKLEKGEVLGI